DAGQLTRALLDRAVDVIGGHVDRLGARDRGPKPGIGAHIAAPRARGHGDLLDVLGEDLPALGVGRAFLALDGAPLRMTGHVRPRGASRRKRDPWMALDDELGQRNTTMGRAISFPDTVRR